MIAVLGANGYTTRMIDAHRSLIQSIKQQAELAQDFVQQVRRHLHTNPELSFEEKETSAFIASKLDLLGIDYTDHIGGYGIRALVKGTGSGFRTTSASSFEAASACAALRADMDALPINEKTGLDFASQKPGIMHACGHDMHSSMLLGAAKILQELRHLFAGTIMLVFQPAEEKVPGGAKTMLDDGLFDTRVPDSIVGQHINPQLEAGLVGFCSGLFMASVDDYKITIKGKGGHGASPHLCVDPVFVAAQVITACQSFVSRRSNPLQPNVLTFGKVLADGAFNIIPDEVYLECTFRTFNEAWRQEIAHELPRCIKQLCQALGANAEVELLNGYPAVFNHLELTEKMRAKAVDFLGAQRVVDLPAVMWAEDFAYYGTQTKACFYNIGTANQAKGWTSPLHSPTMIPDESVLTDGVGLLAWLGLSQLEL